MATKKTVGLVSAGVAAVATLLLMKNKDRIKDGVEDVVSGLKERSAMKLHTKLGTPVYDFIKRKNNIPF